METKRPENLQEARRAARRRRLRRRRIALVVSAVVIVLLISIGVLMAVMDVTAIYVEGETRYTYEQIVEKSGLEVGQNLLSVNKLSAHDRLKEAFPYLDTIEIGNASFSELSITVTEVKEMAAVRVGEDYIIAGENNRALERMPVKEAPKALLKVKGATLKSEKIGDELMDERSLRICQAIIDAVKQYGLNNLTSIDITQKNRISIKLDRRLQVMLGNENNIPTQIAVLTGILPVFYEKNGKEAAGMLDMTSYSDDDPDNDQCPYKTKEQLEEAEQSKKEESTDNKKEDTDKKPEESPEQKPENAGGE